MSLFAGTRNITGRHAGQRGVAAVEFALTVIPLMLLMFGVLQFGQAIYIYDTLVKSTRDAARFLSEYDPTSIDYPSAQAKCLAAYGNVSCLGMPLASGLSTGMVAICDRNDSSACPGSAYGNVATGNGTINLVEVRITGYQFSTISPFINLPTLPFSSIGTAMRQIL